MKTFFALALAVFTVLLSGRGRAAETAAAATILASTNAIEPLPTSSPYGEAKVMRNIAYATNSAAHQNFDLYLPAQAKAPCPLVVWIHGGAWMTGSKEWDNVKYLVRHGYAIATIDYRTTDEAPFPAQIQDCNAALNFILAHAADYGVDGRRLVIGGGSAGGHLALLLGLARHQPGFGADPAVRPAAILDFFGPTDFTTALAQLQAIHSDKGVQLFQEAVPKMLGVPSPLTDASPTSSLDKAKVASPVNYIATNSPPVFILHGHNDDLVPLAQSQQLQSALDRVGVPNRLLEVPDAGHDGPKFSTPKIQTAVLAYLDDFFKSHKNTP